MSDVRPFPGVSSTSQEPVDVVRSMADAFNAHDLEAVLTHFADGFELTMRPAYPRTSDRTFSYGGRAGVREWARKLIEGDFRIEIEVLEADANRVRTSTRTWQNITRRIGLTPVVGIEDYEVEDGKITRLVWTSSEHTRKRFGALKRRFLIGGAIALGLVLVLLWFLIR